METLIDEISSLIQDSRYLAAKKLWQNFVNLHAVDTVKSNDDHNANEIHNRADLEQYQNLDIIKELIERSNEVEKTLLTADVDESWTLGLTYLGITTHYKLNESRTNITVRMEGTLEIPIFEQCAVVHELDLYPEWMPFCSAAKTIEKVSNSEIIPYMCISVPPMSRDLLMRAYAADCLEEEGKVVIIGTTIDSWKDFDIPFRSTGWFHKKMVFKTFEVIFQAISPTVGKTIVIVEIEPNIHLPQVLLNFVIRNLAGMFLYLVQRQAIKTSQDANCPHNQRIRENKAFYQDWLLPKLQKYCESQHWEMLTVKAFETIISPETEIDEQFSSKIC